MSDMRATIVKEHQDKQDPKATFRGEEPKENERAARYEDDSFGEGDPARPSVAQSARANIADMAGDFNVSPNAARLNVIVASSIIAVVIFLFLGLWTMVT